MACAGVSSARSSARLARMGSTWGECDATSTATSRAMTSRCSHCATRSRTVAVSPPITVVCGEATTATTTSSTPRPASSSRTVCSGSSTEAMAPEPASRASSLDRRQMTRTPSSIERDPATTAAATSPMECPITAPGRTPWAAMASARATCMANRVGWTLSMPVTVSGADIASVTENPDSRSISGSRRATAAANTGSVDRSSAPHLCPLRTLAGEHPHRSAIVLPHLLGERGVAGGDLLQACAQLLEVVRDHRRSRTVRCPRRRARV